MARFTVDTHLFRELGDLLVGRDSTALIELVKNSYDADATAVVVHGQGLDDPSSGFIRVTDDGNGMTTSDFELGFLRIASRLKETGTRRSARYGRRYTGAKGIGRLAAHKLARLLDIKSTSRTGKNGAAIAAQIDWDAVEQHETLDEDLSSAITVQALRKSASDSHGTTITLRRLRRKWSPAERSRFLAEVQTFSAPPALTTDVPKTLLPRKVLFDRPVVRDSSTRDPGFGVELQGELAAPEDYWQLVAAACSWVIETDAINPDGQVRIGIAPTRRAIDEGAAPTKRMFRFAHPNPTGGPFFQSRVFVREGRLRLPDHINNWAARVAGIRVYLEGFRVLPYGESRNDWLGLDSDYARRSRSLPFTDDVPSQPDGQNVALRILPNAGYFGGVFLTERGSGSLQMLVNREGFVPDAALDAMVSIVQRSVALAVRVRAATGNTSRGGSTRKPRADHQGTLNRAHAAVSEARQVVLSISAAKSLPQTVRIRLKTAADALDVATAALDDVATEAAMTRVLASVGTQMGAFVHEVNGLLSATEALQNSIDLLSRSRDLTVAARTELVVASESLRAIRRSLERQAAYFVEIVSPDARRRRGRQYVHTSLSGVIRLFEPSTTRRGVTVDVAVADGLRSPPMFPAELAAVWTNLLSNATKAAGRGGRVRISGASEDGTLTIRVDNTGRKIDLANSERWFQPFESTTTETDPLLGQGMGLGLPITRRLIAEYGGTIDFIEPLPGYSTAVRISLPT